MAGNETQLARENYERFCYARDNGHLDFISKAEKCDDYFVGNQWDEAIRSKLERLGKPVITVNKILSTCAAVFGEQLAHRADVSFRPARDGVAETATALDRLWIQLSVANSLDWIEAQVAADGFIRSRGFFDVRVNFDDNMRGEVRIKNQNSKNVVIDPDAEEYDPDTWKEVYLTKWLTINDIELIYGRRFAKELNGRPLAAFTHTYDTIDWLPDNFGSRDRSWGYESTEDLRHRRIYRVIERQFKEVGYVTCLVDRVTGDMREVPSTWSMDRIAKVVQQYGLGMYRRRKEYIRWTVTIDNLVLHNEVSPYPHFTIVPYFPFFLHGRTVGIVENLISPQDLLNKSLSQELHIVNTTANSGWKAKAGSLANMTAEELEMRGAEDGLVIITHGSPDDVQKIQPNQVPTGLDRVSFKADESLKEVSMVSDSMRGFDRADVAAKAIQAKQNRGTVSLAKPFDNLAYTRKLLARNVLDLVQRFYTEERVMNVTGRNLVDQSEQLRINYLSPEGTVVNDLTIGEYDVVISTVPNRETMEQSQFTEAMEMRELGIPIPDDVLVEHSHLNRKSEIAERIRQASGQGEPSAAQQQMQKLELELKQIEAEEKKADIQVKQSNAALNAARAQKELEGDDQKQQLIELEKLAMDKERAQAELQMKREQIEAELALKRYELDRELQLKERELAQEMMLKAREARLKANQSMVESATKAAESAANMETKKRESDAKIAQAAKEKPKPTEKK